MVRTKRLEHAQAGEKRRIVNVSGSTRPRGQARGIGSAAWGSARNGRTAESWRALRPLAAAEQMYWRYSELLTDKKKSSSDVRNTHSPL